MQIKRSILYVLMCAPVMFGCASQSPSVLPVPVECRRLAPPPAELMESESSNLTDRLLMLFSISPAMAIGRYAR
ncbi:hypothetical protein WM04_15220 [Burkholderia ubonensis]|nr:hypothetical protein WM04_15220 [Burkholderia ubonensis]OJB11840.1 hypothetical protein BGV53_27750 [Burkholderia ubonensis]